MLWRPITVQQAIPKFIVPIASTISFVHKSAFGARVVFVSSVNAGQVANLGIAKEDERNQGIHCSFGRVAEE